MQSVFDMASRGVLESDGENSGSTSESSSQKNYGSFKNSCVVMMENGSGNSFKNTSTPDDDLQPLLQRKITEKNKGLFIKLVTFRNYYSSH